MPDTLPTIDATLSPPLIHGPAALAHLANADHTLGDLLAFIGRPAATLEQAAALALDSAYAHELRFRVRQARSLQAQALERHQVYRVRSVRPGTLRLLAILAPGSLMVNTPLDFITADLNVQMDLLFVRPDCPLPAAMPDHDVAFFAVSESDTDALRRLAPLFAAWPRPVLNDPQAVLRLTRVGVADGLRGLPGLTTPQIAEATRAELAARLEGGAPLLPGVGLPLLVRPAGSHAGQDLALIAGPPDLTSYLDTVAGDAFLLSGFVDYRSADGLFRKLRIAFIDGAPFLCHMAVSEHWMVHYLNAGMTESGVKRADESAAMTEFDRGFVVRHAALLAALDRWTGLDYYQIDCAEMPDGTLLVFEADVAAIVHTLDPPDLFPYKRPHMQRAIDAFGDMLRRRAATTTARGIARSAMEDATA